MTTDRDFKRLVRSRMARTGEAYTTARTHLLRRRGTGSGGTGKAATSAAQAANQAAAVAALAPAPASPKPAEYARIAGKSEAAVKKATGCGWTSWVRTLDHVGAAQWPHRAIAQFVHEKYDVPGWWAQSVTVGYERIRGLRETGQRRGGAYETSKSRTFTVPVGRLYRAFKEPRTRRRWLGDHKLVVRTATKDKSMRVTWPDGTSLEIGFYAKGPKKSMVAIQHSKLADRADIARRKEFWSERLERLGGVLVDA